MMHDRDTIIKKVDIIYAMMQKCDLSGEFMPED